MRTIVLAAKPPQEWGKTGENNATALTLNVSTELALWPDGEPQATYYRPDGVVYPVICSLSGNTVSVPLTSTETTTAGRAQIEIQWIDTGVVAKSATFSGNITQSLSEPGAVPADPGQAWLDAVTAVGVAAGVAKTDAETAQGAAEAARDLAQGYAAAMDTAIADAIAPVTSQLAEKTSYGVLNGLVVAAQTTPDMTVKVSAGVAYMSNNTRYAPAAVASIAVTAADATNPRIDIVYLSSAGVVSYLAGTAAATPAAPATPAGGLLLAEIGVAAEATAITGTTIVSRKKGLWTEDWISPTLVNNWTAVSGFDTPGYFKDEFGFVSLRGLLNSGEGLTAAFTLPEGYRPAQTKYFPAASNMSLGIVRIELNGIVYIDAFTSWVSLESISFRV